MTTTGVAVRRVAVMVACSALWAGTVTAEQGSAESHRIETLTSPDGRVVATLTAGDEARYTLAVDGAVVLDPAPLGLVLADGRVLGRGRVERVERREIDETIPTPFGERASVRSRCRELALVLADGATLRARAYDDGLALRWETALPGRIAVADESFNVAFPEEPQAFMLLGRGAHHGYEGIWARAPISSLAAGVEPQTALLPLVFEPPKGPRLALLQVDVNDYPAMYLGYRPSHPRQMSAVFPRRALAEGPGGFRDFDLVVKERASDIAETEGTRRFPWRAFVIARRDADLLGNDMVTRLAPPPAAGSDFSWVKPGKVVWDYWADWNLEGVAFEAGRNDATFRYHVDFAARNGFRYVNIDWYWTDPFDLLAMSPEVDAPGLVAYAREKGVGIFVWCLSRTLERQLEPVLDRFQQWGVAGIKIDFFDRDDQRMMNLYRRFAREAARRKLLVLFHGATAPTGLSREFPNVVGYEAVRGLEYDKFSPEGAPPPHEATIPYTRQLAGPVDYTPGAMRALNRANWKAVHDLPSSQGTLARQLAMYVVYTAGWPMLSDMPTAYERAPEALDFLRAVPTTWDETVGLDGRIGEWVLLARRKGDEWWVGALTDWSRRKVAVPLAFLGDGDWEATLWSDGVNAARVGTDYRRTVRGVTAGEPLALELAPGGGAVMRLRRR